MVSEAWLLVMLKKSMNPRIRTRSVRLKVLSSAHVEHPDVVLAAEVRRLGVDRRCREGHAGRPAAAVAGHAIVRAKLMPDW